MDKKVLVLILGLLIAVSVSTTLTFVTRRTDTSSVVTFGNLVLRPHLYTMEGEEMVEVDSSESLPISEIPSLSRIFNVENVCEHPMYVRVSFDTFIETGGDEQEISNVVSASEKEGWVYSDGFYYYATVLSPGETTTDLMDEIRFNNDKLNNSYRGEEIGFRINVEAVQSEHNKDNVLEAEGWPN